MSGRDICGVTPFPAECYLRKPFRFLSSRFHAYSIFQGNRKFFFMEILLYNRHCIWIMLQVVCLDQFGEMMNKFSIDFLALASNGLIDNRGE